jgi:ABC-type arginine transport system permease subunit
MGLNLVGTIYCILRYTTALCIRVELLMHSCIKCDDRIDIACEGAYGIIFPSCPQLLFIYLIFFAVDGLEEL